MHRFQPDSSAYLWHAMSICTVLLGIYFSYPSISYADSGTKFIIDLMDEQDKACPIDLPKQSRQDCIKRFDNQKKLESEHVYQTLKQSRKFVKIKASDLPKFSDSISEATDKIKALCLRPSSWGDYEHCGYFGGLYVKYFSVSTRKNFLRRKFSGFSMGIELDERAFQILEKSGFNKEPEFIKCIQNMREIYLKSERDVFDNCEAYLGESMGFNLWLSYKAIWAWDMFTLYFTKPKK